MDKQLASLIKKRSTVKSKLTRHQHFLESVADLVAISDTVFLEFKIRQGKLQTLLDEFESLQSELEEIDTNSQAGDSDLEREQFENKYFALSASFEETIKNFETKSINNHDSKGQDSSEILIMDHTNPNIAQTTIHNSSQSIQNDNETINTINTNTNNTQSNVHDTNNHHDSNKFEVNSNSNNHVNNTVGNTYFVKLPQLKLPTFDGQLDLWVGFYDMFSSIMHNNESLTTIQKFQYLKTSLSGEAAAVIQSLELCSSNYSIAFELLKERYENKARIIHNHLKALFEIEIITKESHTLLQSLLNNSLKHIRALKSLGQPVEYWDSILIFLIRSKLDPVSKREWEKLKGDMNNLPTLNELTSFLTKRCQLLESLHINTKYNTITIDKSNRVAAHVSAQAQDCKICKGSHPIFHCSKFLKLTVAERINQISKLRLCKNCFRSNHQTKECKSSTYKKCSKLHNTLLHLEESEGQTTTVCESNQSQMVNLEPSTSINFSHVCTNQVLLPTAVVLIHDHHGNQHKVRTLLDSGSQSSFITLDLCKRLQLTTRQIQSSICGVGNSSSHVSHQTSVTLHSRINSFKVTINCLILTQITTYIPQPFHMNKFDVPEGIQLADPSFSQSYEIEILLGAEVFWSLLCIGQISLGKGKPFIQKTHFGWVVSGSVDNKPPRNHSNKSTCLVSIHNDSLCDIQRQLEAFWQIDQVNEVSTKSLEEIECEEFFKQTHSRGKDGKFIVRLPFKPTIHQLGESFHIANRRHSSLQKRLNQNPILKEQYINFMHEYEKLGHMTLIDNSNQVKTTHNFIPHHAVVKPDRETTKVRVVFDASANSQSGISLNNSLMVGAVIQPDLFTILIKFRLHKVAFTSDCEKMYRQIWVHQDDKRCQNIIWQGKLYQLNTITYGTASAPYLATRCLLQVAIDNKNHYPEACEVIKNSFYVDDLIASVDDVNHAKQVIKQINQLLLSYGFPMRKWSSNFPELLTSLPINNSSSTQFTGEIKSHKTLGIIWSPISDTFQYPYKPEPHSTCVTKRTILAAISTIFDPLGLISPVLVKFKIILQRLWQLQLQWDESIPADLYTTWLRHQQDLVNITNITIPRHVLCKGPVNIQLHSFSDASEVGYGVCIYLRSTDSEGNIRTNLLCAKGRVAPLKTLTIPKLELLAAHLSAKLVKRVHDLLSPNIHINEIYCWCDSTIVLSWFQFEIKKLKTFIAHRVAEIGNYTNLSNWHHVSSGENPADILSHGCSSSQLSLTNAWWHGPTWLSQASYQWPNSVINSNDYDIPELKSLKSISTVTIQPFILDLINKYSSLTKLQRILVYCFRFINASKKLTLEVSSSTALTVKELESALHILVRNVQHKSFSKEIESLEHKSCIQTSSKLLMLHPFLDENKLLRIKGRICNSFSAYNKKFPFILPSKHPFTQLIIRHYHLLHFHSGHQTTLNAIRHTFWIIAGKSTVKQFIHKCVVCKRFDAKPTSQIMGDLPKSRVTPSRPFTICGTDFAGPFLVREGRGRGKRLIKSYLCIFVCFSTKAVHIEIVSDLSTHAFLSCLKRFISRRGMCKEIHSDNATNFQGASKQLREWYQFQSSADHNSHVQHFLSKHLIQWKFIPVRSPHFGGLWEAAVKSAKRLLHKITSNSKFTFEELNTIACQIEAILNSRPLIPLSTNPDDYQFLSPAHFLVGDSLFAVPEPSYLDIRLNRLTRFQMIQQMMQQFWKAWSSEYLNQLQPRTKWQRSNSNQPKFQPGTLVLLRDPQLPPLSWKLGRIITGHPGPDGAIRAITKQTEHGQTTRAVTKVVELLHEDEQ